MDVQKEREAFVEKYRKVYKVDKSLFVNDSGEFTDLFCQDAWVMWQAAKAQAVPEGFVLVPMQPTPRMIDATWNCDEEIQNMSHNSRNEFIYKAMIEAQEQSHD